MSEMLEVATMGDPARVLSAALEELRNEGTVGAYLVSVGHDDGCPCLTDGRPLTACTCEIVQLTRERVR